MGGPLRRKNVLGELALLSCSFVRLVHKDASCKVIEHLRNALRPSFAKHPGSIQEDICRRSGSLFLVKHGAGPHRPYRDREPIPSVPDRGKARLLAGQILRWNVDKADRTRVPGRTLRIPDDTFAEGLEAKFENGVLNLRISKVSQEEGGEEEGRDRVKIDPDGVP